MATLTVTATHDFRGETLSNITDIVFDTSATLVSARFNASQFNRDAISTSVHIAGDRVEEFIKVAVDTAAFSAAAWSFDDWSSLSRVIIESGGGAEDITGSSSQDLTTYSGPNDLTFGESVDGGDGFDMIQTNFGRYDFTVAAVSHVEAIEAQSPQFTSFLLTGTQIGIVNGFNQTQHDHIDLSTIDADQRAANPGNGAFVYIGARSVAGYHATHPDIFGMVRFSNGLLQAPVDADFAPELAMALPGVASLASGDFFL